MSTSTGSRYKRQLLAALCAFIANYLIQIVLGISLLPDAVTSALVNERIKQSALQPNQLSYIASLVAVLSVIGLMFLLVVLREIASYFFEGRYFRIDNTRLLFLATFGFSMLVIFAYRGSGHLETTPADIPVVSVGFFTFIMTLLWVMMCLGIALLLFDPEVFNGVGSQRREKGRGRDGNGSGN